MMKIALTPAFCSVYPDGIFGVLIARGCANRPLALAIAADKRAVEGRLREGSPARPSRPIRLLGPTYVRVCLRKNSARAPF